MSQPDLWAHLWLKKWHKTTFPLFNEMADLIEGTYATGKGVVRAGSPSDSSDSESSDEDELPIDPALTSASATTASPAVPTSTTPTTHALTTTSQAASTPIMSNK